MMADAYEAYQIGLKRLLELLESSHPRYTDLLVYEQRLQENITQTQRYGETELRRAERSEILDRLNQFALEEVGSSFNALYRADSTWTTRYGGELNVVEFSSLSALIGNPDISDPILFLGAGASQKSGVPLSGELVELAAKWAYCRINRRTHDDPTIRRSDWLPWLHQLPWYNPQQSSATQYVQAITHLLQSIEERRSFFQEYSQPQIISSSGYQNLLRLMAERRVRTIFTTNFDTILLNLADTVPNPRRLRGICSPDDYRYLSTDPIHPQIVYLLGNAEHYADFYFDGGYERLNESLIDHLVPLIRDHPLIVIGYSGGEISIVRHLLTEQASRTYNYQHGLYWCVLRSQYPDGIYPSVIQLANTIGPNFRFVLIDNFDELVSELSQTAHRMSPHLPSTASEQPEQVTFDMQLVPEVTLEDLDWPEVQARLLTYCHEMDIPLPRQVTDEWILELIQAQDLARVNDGIHPTVAGSLLFSKSPASCLPTARTEVRVTGEEPVVFTGNLWQQLQVVDLLESEFNAPFRLKGPRSEVTTPYPYLALKEVIVNALAHRRYDGGDSEAIIIQVEPDYIRVTSPGGLYEAVRRQLPPELPPEEALGKQPVKGYRNPVIADFLYGSGAMDKKGSGLVHLREWMRRNGGDVSFRLGADDAFFEVNLYRRPEAPDITTDIASPLIPAGEYVSNILEVVELPSVIWSDETTYRWVTDIRWQSQNSLPAFVLYEGRLYTFSDLSKTDNPLRNFTQGTDIQVMSLADFTLNGASERRLVNLMNEAVNNFAERNGLIFDWKRKRTYFPRADDGDRTITYQARLRKATRTVVKARISPTTNQVSYWEHQALELKFKKFGDRWGLQLLPTYVFTFNGYSQRLPGERNGPLATRKLAREYNAHVDSHLVFWTTVLSDEKPDIVLENALGSFIQLRSTPISCVLHTLEPQPEEETEESSVDDEELDELEDQLSEFDDEDEDLPDDVADD